MSGMPQGEKRRVLNQSCVSTGFKSTKSSVPSRTCSTNLFKFGCSIDCEMPDRIVKAPSTTSAAGHDQPPSEDPWLKNSCTVKTLAPRFMALLNNEKVKLARYSISALSDVETKILSNAR